MPTSEASVFPFTFPLTYIQTVYPKTTQSKLIVRVTTSYAFIQVFFSEYYDEIKDLIDLYEPYMQNYRPYNFVFFTPDNKAVGFISLNLPLKKGYKVYFDIWVRPDFRGKGYAQLMYRTVEGYIKNVLKKIGHKCIYATVHKNNTPSLRALKKLGFKPVSKEVERHLRFRRRTLGPNEVRVVKCYRL